MKNLVVRDAKLRDEIFKAQLLKFRSQIDIFDNNIPDSELKNVIIFSNFNVTDVTINTNFPNNVTDTWYDLMDPTGTTTIADGPRASVTIPAGGFRIFGNQPSSLSTNDVSINQIQLFPNPTNSSFSINTSISELSIYDVTGKLVKVFEGNKTTNQDFDVSDIKTGIYIVQIVDSNNRQQSSKLIKQ